jgi:hypothetical protein
VDGTLRGGLVEEADELAVLLRRALAITLLDRALQALEKRLGARAVAKILHPLPGGRFDATLLLLDVRHAAADATSGEGSSGSLLMLAA